MLTINNCEVIQNPEKAKTTFKTFIDAFPCTFTTSKGVDIQLTLESNGETLGEAKGVKLPVNIYCNINGYCTVKHTQSNGNKEIGKFKINK